MLIMHRNSLAAVLPRTIRPQCYQRVDTTDPCHVTLQEILIDSRHVTTTWVADTFKLRRGSMLK